MPIVGYHASHEQFAPGQLLEWVVAAEQAGFTAAMSSDHFFPWSESQGQSGFAWSWLGAALHATTFPIGVVTVPGGWRYHPAIIAQATATLADMFPDRFWVAAGSGEALNEHIVGEGWPPKEARNARLQEAVEVMRALLAGEMVTHHGLITVETAKLYTRPDRQPLILGAAITEKTAEWLGGWADGLLTVSKPLNKLRKVVDAFRRGGGEGKPMYLQAKLSYAESEEKALQGAYEQWRTNIFKSKVLATLELPEQFEAAAQFVRPEDIHDHVKVSTDLQEYAAWLQGYAELGFEHIYLHNVNREQQRFIEAFGAHVLPQLALSDEERTVYER